MDEFVPPTALPSDEWIVKLRQAVAKRPDVVSVYLVGCVYDWPESHIQDTAHIELLDPPTQAATPDEFRQFIEIYPSGGPGFTFTPVRLLAAVSRAGVRIA
jgi:hypothetical protein